MSEENEHREEKYHLDGDYHKSPNQLIDGWGRHLVASLGTSHAWVLTVVCRLTLGFGYRARRVPISTVVKLSGLGRGRAYEVLEDLEATGVLSIRDRRRGRVPLLTVDLDWNPAKKLLARGQRAKRARIDRKGGGEEAEMSTTVNNPRCSPQ